VDLVADLTTGLSPFQNGKFIFCKVTCWDWWRTRRDTYQWNCLAAQTFIAWLRGLVQITRLV
jgi:hypothetical protein